MNRPKRLFHCYPDKAKAIFQEWRLWFSALKDFNDPFEGMPSFKGPIDEIVSQGLRKAYAFLPPTDTRSSQEYRRGPEAQKAKETAAFLLPSLQEKFREKCSQSIRIFCFTETTPDLAMWGHYAACHRGFVIEFEPSHPLFNDLKEVQYQEKRPEPQEVGDMQFLHIKHALWQKEHEYRLIKKASDLGEEVRSDGKRLRFVPLPHEAVKTVFFGWQMPPATREQMVKDLGTISVQSFVMEPHLTNYALIETPIEKYKPPAAEVEAMFRDAFRI
jgi:hypothetical protein